jgi:hypothetical protein
MRTSHRTSPERAHSSMRPWHRPDAGGCGRARSGGTEDAGPIGVSAAIAQLALTRGKRARYMAGVPAREVAGSRE